MAGYQICSKWEIQLIVNDNSHKYNKNRCLIRAKSEIIL